MSLSWDISHRCVHASLKLSITRSSDYLHAWAGKLLLLCKLETGVVLSLCLSISLTDVEWDRLIRVMKECADDEIRLRIDGRNRCTDRTETLGCAHLVLLSSRHLEMKVFRHKLWFLCWLDKPLYENLKVI